MPQLNPGVIWRYIYIFCMYTQSEDNHRLMNDKGHFVCCVLYNVKL